MRLIVVIDSPFNLFDYSDSIVQNTETNFAKMPKYMKSSSLG